MTEREEEKETETEGESVREKQIESVLACVCVLVMREIARDLEIKRWRASALSKVYHCYYRKNAIMMTLLLISANCDNI